MTVFDLRVVISRLDPILRRSLEEAVARAVSRSHPSVEIEHWLAELLRPDGAFTGPMRELQMPVDRAQAELSTIIDRKQGQHAGAPSLSRNLIEWIEEAWLTASLRFGRNKVDAADLIAALTTSATLQRLLRDIAPSLKLDESRVLALAAEVPADPPSVDDAVAKSGGGKSSQKELDRYTIDLTAQARAGRLDPVIGRENELRQVIDILMRRRQNNPILTGEAGVGKTAVVEALALRIAARNVPEALAGVTIRALDLGLLQAGAGVKGEFERRLTGVIEEIKTSAQPIILFIDEAHTMIGAGAQPGGSDAANLLKPALARGELRTIAATTWSEYKRHIERDPALTRRFQVVKVDEPAADIAVRMLRGIVPALEAHHGVHIKDEALVAAVQLSARHLPERQLPDKAISVLDTAAANVAISRATDPAVMEDLAAECRSLEVERDALLREEDNDNAARLAEIDAALVAAQRRLEDVQRRHAAERDLVCAIETADSDPRHKAELTRRLGDLQGETPLIHRCVDREAVAAVVARWTGVPVGKLVRNSIATTLSLEARLRERVVGQDQALAVIAAAMRSAAAKLSDPRKPPGVFLMVGTSGVGKTETALALADQLYGGSQHLTVINLSEFKEEHKVSMLLGSPPGYVGYGEGGVLTEAVRRRPYGLLLLDEAEKAHSGVQDVFFQVFDKGMLRDGEGRDIEFRNTTIILTSNAGAETLAALAVDPDTMPSGEALIETLRPELLRHFKPAFLGRVTIVPYLPLTPAILRDITDLQIERICTRLDQAHKTGLEVDEAVRAAIVSRCLAGDIGARAIDSILTRDVLPLLSDLILNHLLAGAAPKRIRLSIGAGEHFVATVEDGQNPNDVDEGEALQNGEDLSPDRRADLVQA